MSTVEYDTILDAGLEHMRRGWKIFPTNGKIPATNNGVLDASVEDRLAGIWWELHPDRGIGLATGEPSGVWALDLDSDDAVSRFAAMRLEHGDASKTVVSRTRRGYHLLFKMPTDGTDIRNSAGQVGDGIDVRGTGGYIVLPPSPHPDGGLYAWRPGQSPDETDVAETPSWLLDLVTKRQAGPRQAAPTIEGAINEGGRNTTLASLAGSLRRRGGSREAILAAIQVENTTRCTPPLPDDEVDKIADSVSRYSPSTNNGTDPSVSGGPGPAEHSSEPDLELSNTDTGNSSRFVDLHGERLHYLPTWGRWIVCGKDAFWTQDHRDVRVRELAKDVGHVLRIAAAKEPDPDLSKKMFGHGTQSLNTNRITGMVDLARGIDGIPLDHEHLDRDGWLLGVKNGVVDLRSGELRDADPDDLMTMRCPVPWDHDATADRWEQAMVEWFPDPEVRTYVQRVAGSALVGSQRDHVFVIHFGDGGNGKGTFTRALQEILGPYALEIHLSLLVESKYKEHDTVKADLFRARLAIAVETERRVRLAEASVKNLTGGDRIRARRMREDPWSFDPTHSLWLQTNHLPEISGRDTGIWRRIRVVKWENTFVGGDDDRDLKDALAAEASGILRWLVEGCLQWQEHGLAEPEAVIRATLAYRRAEDTFARFQTDTGLVFDPELKIQAAILYDLLSEWAQEEGADPQKQEIGEWLRENGAQKKQRTVTKPDGTTKRPKFWVGIGFPAEKHEAEQTDVRA